MKLFTATVAQTATVASITAVDIVTTALNATEAFKASGAGYNDRSMVKLAAEIICNESAICAIEGNKVTKVGIERLVVPFGVAIRLSNGQGHRLSIIHTTLGTVITERDACGWSRKILTVNEVKEMLTTFTGAVPTATDLKESVSETRRSHRITPAAVKAAGERAEAARLEVVRHNDSWANIN